MKDTLVYKRTNLNTIITRACFDFLLKKEYAQEWAEKWGLSTEEITWDQLDKIRKEYAAKRAQQLNESQNKK